MADIDFLPRKLHTAFDRLAAPEAIKAILAAVPGNPAYCSEWEDFLGDAVEARHPANGGTGTQVVGITVAPNGTLTAATQGNQATDSAIQSLWDLNWNGDLGVYMVTRFKVSTLATMKFNVGLSDEQTDTGAVATKATPTFNVSDCACISFDTADDTNLTVQTNGGSNDLNQDITAFTLAADTFMVLEIVLQNNNASFYIDGKYVGGGTEVIEGGTAMRPYFYIEQNGAGAVTLTVDYCGIIGCRS